MFTRYDHATGQLVWTEPTNLHDKIIYLIKRKHFNEHLAKARHMDRGSIRLIKYYGTKAVPRA